MRRRLALLLLLLLLLCAPPDAAPAQPAATAETAETAEVDIELVLAVDISRSMDLEELRLQRDGYVAAFRDPAVIRAVEGGLLGRIAVLYLEWAGAGTRDAIGGWTLIDGAEAAARFADRLAAAPVGAAMGTSISGALAHAAEAFEGNGFRGLRRVVDISGDGPNNSGPAVTRARDAALARGVAINGLPVMLKARDGPFSLARLDVYYEDCVIGGPLSFVLPLRAAEKFGETIRRKLILEISGRRPAPRPGAPPAGMGAPPVIPAQMGLSPPRAAPRIDCLIGEKLRRRWLEQGGWDW